jgi:nitrogen regulatory protein PII
MEPVKRIEIVVDSPEVPELLQILRREGIGGYTVFGHLRGGGDRGERRDDEPSGGGNACILVAVPAAKLQRVIEVVRPVLKRRGGMCLVGDAHWVVH